jgi:hypothetical protein
MSDGGHSETIASAHQGYIERPSATELSTPEVDAFISQPSDAQGDEDVVLSDGFSYPDRNSDIGRTSFGTLGTTKAERKNFWNVVEQNEARRARVQSRIIAELPMELDQMERVQVASDFCQNFEDRKLPYWATLHAPSKRNDKRNFHLHIVYFDRPAGRDENGKWDFSVSEERTRKKSRKYTVRPFKNDKHSDTRDIHWPKRLRRSYSDSCNFHLSLGGHEKRHDPRSYKDSGVNKEPTEHLGNTLSAMETFGLDTEPGKRNARREIRWKIEQAEAPWVARWKLVQENKTLQSDSMTDIRESLVAIASNGITSARKSASYSITSELLEARPTQRISFLEQEVQRLRKKDDLSSIVDTTQAISALSSEAAIIKDRQPQIMKTSQKCKDQGALFSKRSRVLAGQFDRLYLSSDQSTLFDEGEMEPLGLIDEIMDNDLDDPEAQNMAPSYDENSIFDAEDLDSINDVIDDIAIENDQTEEPNIHSARPEGRRRKDPIQQIIDSLSQDQGLDSTEVSTQAKQSRADFPEAWPVDKPDNPNDVKLIDRELRDITNRDLRHKAIATRDATDLCEQGIVRNDLNRGWNILRFEAARRGLDLDTGKHDPTAANDPDRAKLHTDQDPCPIRVVRKNIARQRVRG